MSRPLLTPSEVLAALAPACLVAALPAAARLASSRVDALEAWLAVAALSGPLLLAGIAVLRIARRSLDATPRGALARATTGVSLWALTVTPGTAALATILKTHTHHRGLAGAAFGAGALLVYGVAAVAARRLAVGLSPRARPDRARSGGSIALAVSACVLVGAHLAIALSLGASGPPTALALPSLLVDGTVALAASVAAAAVDLPEHRARGASWIGGGALVFVSSIGLAFATRSPALTRGLRTGAPMASGIARIIGLGEGTAELVRVDRGPGGMRVRPAAFDVGSPMTTFTGMDDFIRSRPLGYSRPLVEAPAEKLAFLRKVYALFTGSIIAAAAGAMVALYAGADLSRVTVEMDGAVRAAPPLVVFFVNHWMIGMALFLGSFFGASAVRERPGINVLALFGASFVSGLYIAPMLWYVQFAASMGHTLSASPVRDAFVLAVLGFTGLTTYALTTKRDFSFLAGFLSMGFWVLLGAMLLNFFVGGASLSLAIASVGVLLFGGYILFDTSRILRDPENRDAVGAALGLYLNLMNLFIFLLRILGSRRES